MNAMLHGYSPRLPESRGLATHHSLIRMNACRRTARRSRSQVRWSQHLTFDEAILRRRRWKFRQLIHQPAITAWPHASIVRTVPTRLLTIAQVPLVPVPVCSATIELIPCLNTISARLAWQLFMQFQFWACLGWRAATGDGRLHC